LYFILFPRKNLQNVYYRKSAEPYEEISNFALDFTNSSSVAFSTKYTNTTTNNNNNPYYLVTESRKRSSELYYSLDEANNGASVVLPMGSSKVSLPSHPIPTTPSPPAQLYSHVGKQSPIRIFFILAVLLALVLILIYFLIGHIKSDSYKVSSNETTTSKIIDSPTPLTTTSSNLRLIFSYLSTLYGSNKKSKCLIFRYSLKRLCYNTK
jgi:hypothetical protein